MLNPRAQQTLRHVALLKTLRVTKRPRGKIPRQIWPHLLETEYAKALIERMNLARGAMRELLDQLPDMLEQARRSRADSCVSYETRATAYLLPRKYRIDEMDLTRQHYDADETSKLSALLERARAALERSLRTTEVEDLAREFAQRTTSYQRIQLGRQVKAALGADVFASDRKLPAITSHFINENVQLIKSIPGDVISEVHGVINRAFTNATPHDVVARQIEERFGVGQSRARLIARDQIGKIYGQTNAARQKELGIESFVWRTVGDERVRDEHEALNGEEFRYDDPPDEGLPGEPIQCRCYAEPVFGDLLNPDADTGDEPAQSAEQEPAAPAVESAAPPVTHEPITPPVVKVVEPTPHDFSRVGFTQGTQQQQQQALRLRAEERRLAAETARVAHEAAERVHAEAVANAERLAQEKETARLAREQAQEHAAAAERAVSELLAEHTAEVEQLHTGFRIGVTSEIQGSTESHEVNPKAVQPAHAPIVSRETPAPAHEPETPIMRIGVGSEIKGAPEPEPVKKVIPAPLGFTGIEHNGEVYYKHEISGRAYTKEQLKERGKGYGIVLTGPNEHVSGYETIETKHGTIKHRSEETGQVYTPEQIASGEAKELDKWLIEYERKQAEAEKPGPLKRLAMRLFGIGR